MYMIIGIIDAYIKKRNGSKYLVFATTDKSKELLTTYAELWNGIGNLLEWKSVAKSNDRPSKFEKDFMKIKFYSDDNLPLNKILKFHNLTIVFRSGLTSFLDQCLYAL